MPASKNSRPYVEKLVLAEYEVLAKPFHALLPADLAEWMDLEEKAVEGNCFLSPCFVAPAIKHFSQNSDPIVLRVWSNKTDQRRLIGLGVFTLRQPVRYLPVIHLSSFRTDHTYTTGLLLDSYEAVAALQAFIQYATKPEQPWHAIEFTDLNLDGPLAGVMRRALGLKAIFWYERYGYYRACLNLHCDVAPSTGIKSSTRKDLIRRKRRLEESGRVAQVICSGDEVSNETIERFLQLEDMGWKGQEQSSLLASPSHAEFFREMSMEFARHGKALFYELLFNGAVIASACNYISGRRAYAFKIGWDPRYANASPGYLNELAFLDRLADRSLGFEHLDSGALAGSFVDRLWRDRCYMSSGFIPTTSFGQLTLITMRVVRHLRMLWRKTIGRILQAITRSFHK